VAVTVVVGAKAASAFEPKTAKERMPKATLMIARASLNVLLHYTIYTTMRDQLPKGGRGMRAGLQQLPPSNLFSILQFSPLSPILSSKNGNKREPTPLATHAHFLRYFSFLPVEGAMKILDHLEL